MRAARMSAMYCGLRRKGWKSAPAFRVFYTGSEHIGICKSFVRNAAELRLDVFDVRCFVENTTLAISAQVCLTRDERMFQLGLYARIAESRIVRGGVFCEPIAEDCGSIGIFRSRNVAHFRWKGKMKRDNTPKKSAESADKIFATQNLGIVGDEDGKFVDDFLCGSGISRVDSLIHLAQLAGYGGLAVGV